MKKFKKLLSVMLVSTLLVANVIPVSAAEIQPRDAAPALTQFYVYSVSSEKGGTEVIQRSGSFAQVGTTLDHGGGFSFSNFIFQLAHFPIKAVFLCG